VGVVGRWRGTLAGLTERHQANLTNLAALAALVRDTQPDCILHTAAISDPAACEASPLVAQQMNVELPAALAQLAAARGIRLVHVSSEQVFDGEHAPYTPADPPAPLNLYGRQKAESEQRVLAAAPAAAVVRASLLLGNSPAGRRSMHEKLFETWHAGRRMRLYTDEIRQVCSADNLAAALLELAERPDLTGLFHWAGAEPASRWEIGRRLAAHFGVAEKWLEPVVRAMTPEISARRPRDLSLRLAPLDRELSTRPQALDEAIAGLVEPARFAGWRPGNREPRQR
jgi:dTDP-4-dehydrorhamnose reductase